METLCKAIGLTDLYLPFMIESAYIHPSANGADVYLEPLAEGNVRLRIEPSLPPTPLRVIAMWAGLATRALGALTGDDQFERLADEIQARLGVEIRLPGDPVLEG